MSQRFVFLSLSVLKLSVNVVPRPNTIIYYSLEVDVAPFLTLALVMLTAQISPVLYRSLWEGDEGSVAVFDYKKTDKAEGAVATGFDDFWVVLVKGEVTVVFVDRDVEVFDKPDEGVWGQV